MYVRVRVLRAGGSADRSPGTVPALHADVANLARADFRAPAIAWRKQAGLVCGTAAESFGGASSSEETARRAGGAWRLRPASGEPVGSPRQLRLVDVALRRAHHADADPPDPRSR